MLFEYLLPDFSRKTGLHEVFEFDVFAHDFSKLIVLIFGSFFDGSAVLGFSRAAALIVKSLKDTKAVATANFLKDKAPVNSGKNSK